MRTVSLRAQRAPSSGRVAASSLVPSRYARTVLSAGLVIAAHHMECPAQAKAGALVAALSPLWRCGATQAARLLAPSRRLRFNWLTKWLIRER